MAEEYENIRLLLVDDDPTSWRELEELFQSCQYHVTTTSSTVTAIQLLREARGSYDLVVSNIFMPKMDGFSLLAIVKREMNIPVILVSAIDDEKLMKRAILGGASEFMTKPLKLQRVQNLWQHVVREREFEMVERSDYRGGEDGENDRRNDSSHGQESDAGDKYRETKQAIGATGGRDHGLNRAKQDEEQEEKQAHKNDDSNECSSARRNKKRLIWTKELHERFLNAIELISPHRPVPRLIMKVMNIPYLTLHNIASHLQKYRLHERKKLHAQATALTCAGTSLPGPKNPIVQMNTAPFVITDTVPPLLPPHSNLNPLDPPGLQALGLPGTGVPTPSINTHQNMMPPASSHSPFLADSRIELFNTPDHMTPPQNHMSVQARYGQHPIYGWNPLSSFVYDTNPNASNFGFPPLDGYNHMSNNSLMFMQGCASYGGEPLVYNYCCQDLLPNYSNGPCEAELIVQPDGLNAVKEEPTSDMNSGQTNVESGSHSNLDYAQTPFAGDQAAGTVLGDASESGLE